MAYSIANFTYNGGPQVFPTNFALGVLETSHLVVNVDGEVDGLGNPLEFAFTYDAGTGAVTITDTLPIPSVGVIRRVVPVDNLLVDFEANADVTKRNLARSTKQVLMAVQEAADARASDAATVADVLEVVTDLQTTIADDIALVEAAATVATDAAISAEASAAAAEAKQNTIIVPRGPWVTATSYALANLVYFGGATYECILAHVSGVFATDLSASRWRLFADKGAAGVGAGDMLNADNLSGLTNKPLAYTILGGKAVGKVDLLPFSLVDPAMIITDVETLAANASVTTAVPTAKAVTDYVTVSIADANPIKAWAQLSSESKTGTYSRSGNIVTVTMASHGMTTGQKARLDFTSGAASDGYYTVTVISSSVFTVTDAASGTTSGNVTRTFWVRDSYGISDVYRVGGPGDIGFKFTTPFANEFYAIIGTALARTNHAGFTVARNWAGPSTATDARILVGLPGASSVTGTYEDSAHISVMFLAT